jgi:hypothetical protein
MLAAVSFESSPSGVDLHTGRLLVGKRLIGR